MNKYFLVILLFVLSSSCAQKPNLRDIQQTVFGNLPIGVKQQEYNRQFQSIAASTMSVTRGTRYPFFKLDEKGFLDRRLTFLYPHAFQNSDSIVTKIVFYTYQVKFVSEEVVQAPTTTPEQRKILEKGAVENQNRLDYLVNEFDTRRKVDSLFTFYLPNVAQGWDCTSLEDDITSKIEKKYNKPTTRTHGNEYDKYDYSFYKELLWKTDKLNIRFVKRRYPVSISEPSGEFFFVLIYEFNDDVKKKYNLTKEKDLSQTF